MKVLRLLPYAFIGWTVCGAIVGIGRKVTSIENALMMHLIGAPLVFAVLTKMYFRKRNDFSCLHLASLIVAFILFMDFFVVSLVIEKNFDMFKSLTGTWVPVTLIFIATYLVGKKEETKHINKMNLKKK